MVVTDHDFIERSYENFAQRESGGEVENHGMRKAKVSKNRLTSALYFGAFCSNLHIENPF